MKITKEELLTEFMKVGKSFLYKPINSETMYGMINAFSTIIRKICDERLTPIRINGKFIDATTPEMIDRGEIGILFEKSDGSIITISELCELIEKGVPL